MKKKLFIPVAAVMLVATGAFGYTNAGAAGEKVGERETPAGTAHHTDNRNDCDFGAFNTAAAGFVPVPDSVVSIHNPTAVVRDAIVTFSTEANTSSNTNRLNIRYSVDGGPFTIFGPEFAASGTVFETVTNVSVIHIPPGNHIIRPGVSVSGGGSGTVFFRCLSVELAA